MNFETTIPGLPLERSINRATSEPGGCECTNCGQVFIGGPDDTLCGVCYFSMQDSPTERRANRKAQPIDAAHARIGELLLAYGSACAAYHFGPEVTAAYQVCMAEILKYRSAA